MEDPTLKRDIENFISNVLERTYGVKVDEVRGMFDSDAAMERVFDRVATLPAPREDSWGGRISHAEFVQLTRDNLKSSLSHLFGEISEGTARRIDEAHEEDIRRWLGRLAEAGSVEDVFPG